MTLTPDYEERVYAGVLGKLIGVYLGRPFEGWTYERIMAELGEIEYYVNDRLPWKPPLVVSDDDVSGTFTFLRALPDYGYPKELTAAQIGQTWLNYIIEKRTILWWGGMGNSTEHTAYLRLKNGYEAPDSGSIAVNGKLIAEQIGAQIFIDGWGMVAPGQPELAARLAARAASVSHDGEAIYGSQVLAAMEAQAFVESDMNTLIDCGISFIPKDSVIYRMIADIREWHAGEPDWHKTREKIAATYGYDKYGGNCHIVPNHGLVVFALLYGEDDFQKSLMVVNTAGWDTDCNSGNVGCLMGIKNGLSGLEAGPDWRGPIADRLYLPTADGGRSITDAVTESYHIVNAGRALAGAPPRAPKNGARFHFSFPGSVQGFTAQNGDGLATVRVRNASRPGKLESRCLQLTYDGQEPGLEGRVATATFIPADAIDMAGYKLLASPTLYSGQIVRAAVDADEGNGAALHARLHLAVYDTADQLAAIRGPEIELQPGASGELAWKVPDTAGAPVAEIGLSLHNGDGSRATAYLDYLTWEGAPDVVLTRPIKNGNPADGPFLWRRAWTDGVDQWDIWWKESYRLVQNKGRGLIIQGTRQWSDYEVESAVTATLMAWGGIAARVQGLQRYYALLLGAGDVARLVKLLDGETVLAETAFKWRVNQEYRLRLRVEGARLLGWIDDQLLFDVRDEQRPLLDGAAGLVLEEGTMMSDVVVVRP